MKRLNFLSLFFLLTLLSCAGGGEMEFDSPDQYTHITLSAESASMPMDPLQVKVSVRSPAFSKEMSLEAEMSNLSAATCSIKWLDARTALIQLQERDETSRMIEVISDSTQLRIRVVSSNE
jgi:hypothetical protein